ncbi:hypothetical protein DENSPDRAFT_625386 [Dentipellis sp. KUC8613]|nr:hypothetical protein DENSPDRAFT_625386 [Dentipellis sp. KUC8613]
MYFTAAANPGVWRVCRRRDGEDGTLLGIGACCFGAIRADGRADICVLNPPTEFAVRSTGVVGKVRLPTCASSASRTEKLSQTSKSPRVHPLHQIRILHASSVRTLTSDVYPESYDSYFGTQAQAGRDSASPGLPRTASSLEGQSDLLCPWGRFFPFFLRLIQAQVDNINTRRGRGIENCTPCCS